MSRAKGSGCLVKRGKFFFARWTVNGHVHTRSTKCTKKSEALKKLAEFVHPFQTTSNIETLENLESQIHVLESSIKRTPKKDAVKLMFAVDVYKNDANTSKLADGTYDMYDGVFNLLKKFVAPKEYVWQVTDADAAAFMKDCKDKCSITTYNTRIRVLKCIIDVLMKHDTNIRRNVFKNFKQLGEISELKRRELKTDEVDKLFKAAESIDKETLLLFQIGAFTGLRKSDCKTLKWDEVDMDAHMIRRLPKKTGKNKLIAHIPIAKELYEVLKNADKSTEHVLPTIAEMSIQKMTALITTVFDKAGIKISEVDKDGKKHIITGFHAFRHTFASKLNRARTPLNQIKIMLGHKKIDMSMEYIRSQEDDLQLPDFYDSTVNVQIKKELYDNIMSYKKNNEDFNDILKRVLENKLYDEEAAKKIRLEREAAKKKQDEEIDQMLDEIFADKAKQTSSSFPYSVYHILTMFLLPDYSVFLASFIVI